MAGADGRGAPLFDAEHIELAELARELAVDKLEPLDEAADAGAEDLHRLCQRAVRHMAAAELLQHVVPAAHGGASKVLSVRSLVAIREGLAYGSGLADALFALQGLGSLPITLAGTEAQRAQWLGSVADGSAIMGFAMTEPDAGSDPASMTCVAQSNNDGSGYHITGTKTFISNAGLADEYALFASTDPTAGHRGITCFLVPGDAPGMTVEPLEPMAAHPLGTLTLAGVEVPNDAVVGEVGRGFHLALSTLDVMRPTVAAAACGMAHRALDEALARCRTREQFGRPIGAFQGLRWELADAATDLEAAYLLTRQAAWTKDHTTARTTVPSAQAKLFATEAAQRIVDLAVQVHGGTGVMRGSVVERLYRDVRALRIYEGTSEVLRDVVGKAVVDLPARDHRG